MKKTNLMLLIALAILLLTGCSAKFNSVQPVGIRNIELEPLKSSEYEIVKNVTGTATVKTFLIFRIEGENKSGFLASNLNLKSDIDLAIEHHGKLTEKEIVAFRDWLDEFPTLYSIDLVELEKANDLLKQEIGQYGKRL